MTKILFYSRRQSYVRNKYTSMPLSCRFMFREKLIALALLAFPESSEVINGNFTPPTSRAHYAKKH